MPDPVGIRPVEAEHELSVGTNQDAVLGERGVADVSAKLLQGFAVAGLNGGLRMKVEARRLGASRGQDVDDVVVGEAAVALDTLAWPAVFSPSFLTEEDNRT